MWDLHEEEKKIAATVRNSGFSIDYTRISFADLTKDGTSDEEESGEEGACMPPPPCAQQHRAVVRMGTQRAPYGATQYPLELPDLRRKE